MRVCVCVCVCVCLHVCVCVNNMLVGTSARYTGVNSLPPKPLAVAPTALQPPDRHPTTLHCPTVKMEPDTQPPLASHTHCPHSHTQFIKLSVKIFHRVPRALVILLAFCWSLSENNRDMLGHFCTHCLITHSIRARQTECNFCSEYWKHTNTMPTV